LASFWQGSERFKYDLSIFLIDPDSIVQHFDMQLTFANEEFTLDSDVGVIVRELQRIID
jgi:hypothetical protein